MSKKLYIDLATRIGWARYNNGTITSGFYDLDKETIIEEYVSSQCRKTVPDKGIPEENSYKFNHEKDKWCLIKEKKVVKHLTIQEQYERLIESLTIKDDCKVLPTEFIIEQQAVPTGQISKRFEAIKKQFGLYAITKLQLGDVREIRPNDWFDWISDKYSTYKVFKTIKTGTKIDRKATSLAIANHCVVKKIIDHNEADAICMLMFDNQDDWA